jgi:hypothetical protein
MRGLRTPLGGQDEYECFENIPSFLRVRISVSLLLMIRLNIRGHHIGNDSFPDNWILTCFSGTLLYYDFLLEFSFGLPG